MNLIFLGLPGTGKGTQAVVVAKEFAIPHIATGDLFRRAIKEDTSLGRTVKEYLDTGGLVPDGITLAMVKERLGKEDTRDGFILDGFPRTVVQAKGLAKIMAELGRKMDGVICFNVEEEILVQRLTGRRVCSNCGANYHVDFKKPQVEGICDECGKKLYQRQDDQEETVKNRLKVNKNNTLELMDYYKKQGLLVTIAATAEPSVVTANLFKVLGGLQ